MILICLWALCASSCKEHCPPCRKIPDDAQSLIGEWEWDYTVMGSSTQVGGVYHYSYDTITPQSTGSAILVEVSKGGCYRFWIDNEEYCSCVRINNSIRGMNSIDCNDVMDVKFSGLDLCYEGVISVRGDSDCVLDGMRGRDFPLSNDRQFLEVPELLPGYTLVNPGYVNYFVRKQ